MKRLLVLSIFALLFAPALLADPDSTGASSERGFLGIYAETVSKEKAAKMGLENHFGTLVTGVIPNTAAEKAGLQVFDYLYGIDAYRSGEGQTFSSILAKYAVGDKAKLYYIRKGQSKTVDITFGKRPETIEKKELDKCESTFLGITPHPNWDSKKMDGIKINPVKNSTAMDIGLQNGDVILKINGYLMTDWADIGYVLRSMKPGDAITVSYQRGDKEAKASGKIKSYAETKDCKKCDCSDLNEKEINIRVEIPDIEINIPPMPRAPRAPAPPARADVSEMDAQIQDMSGEDVRQWSDKFGWKIQTSGQPLAVERLRISPDAGTSRFNLSFDLPQRGDTAVRLFNALGRAIYEYELSDFTGSFTDMVDIAQNGPGDYFLEIRQGDRSKVVKVTLNGK